MVQILHVQVQAPETHESHITAVRWYNPDDGQIAVALISVMVDFIRGGGTAYTFNGRRFARVEVVEAAPPHIRTVPDISISDNLLSLPRF
jgi:hypothetical protein